ncbi:MAG: ATP synthase F1 subunit gamma [Bacteroidetes bacterium]|nr:ATP synthase F1 subunit gamma [Bacteroidota bacterium]
MASLKEIRIRISSVKSTRQITSAMKMVAAARLRKSQDAILRMRPYAQKLHEILTNLSAGLDTTEENIYAQQREPGKILLVMISSNRGLCGSFNSNIIKRTNELITGKYADQYRKGKVSFIAIGKKGADFLKKKKMNMLSSHNELFDNLTFANITPVAESIMKRFVNKTYDRVELIYNEFKNPAVQILTNEQFLPIEMKEEEGVKLFYDYIFEPSKEYIVNDLIPKSLKVQFFKALLDSYASEHGARMTAMHQATDNATELLRDLNLEYNKARQAAITKEILEIVSGAEALKG